ncbi:DUF438 domain-containing protein [Propionispora hippei]|uniref:PAC domain-containing protein n=1 Tax=Propionispora hippei DSM 15287 TaxID=1123003 RepID=A0A1M6MAT1_9FIRM|nr:DUF438 domain-containing protein [Propionispora hippei]SHJ80571.1 hypothetical protein SAMN02745170_03374 [Propionispora hippei DSM 15287]
MSELINNREHRKQVIKEILRDLHRGKSVEEVKPRFDAVAGDLAPAEISLIEQSLIDEGMDVAEIQNLCDVHAAVFKETLSEKPDEAVPQGHPLDIYRDENQALEKLIDEEINPLLAEFKAASAERSAALAIQLAEKLNLLWDVDKHYSRKENLIFPFLEKYGITAPPKVMWGVDDEIRVLLKESKQFALHYQPANREQFIEKLEKTLEQVREMIFKESKILFPMLLETLSENDWLAVQNDSDQIGYCLIEPQLHWTPAGLKEEPSAVMTSRQDTDYIKFATGVLTPKEIEHIFNHLPVDITFVDKDGIVKYFSTAKERIFHRTKTIIGRKVENCHPPASVHIVEQIAADLKSGKKGQESFWIKMGDKFVYIQYFAVRDDQGEFLGILEVTQNIQPLQQITGEKRIMD